MNNNEQQIDDYVMNRLDPDEKRAFEATLAADPSLQNELKMRQFMIGAIQALGEIELRNKLNQIHDEVVPPAPKRDYRKYWPLLLIAILLVVVGVYVGRQKATPPAPKTPEQIFAANYQAPSINFTDRSNSANDTIALVENAYSHQEFQKALPLLTSFHQNHPSDDKVTLALGICLMETGDLNGALDIFTQLKENQYFGDKALWYGALINMKIGNKDKAKELLNALSKDNESNFAEKAKAILEGI